MKTFKQNNLTNEQQEALRSDCCNSPVRVYHSQLIRYDKVPVYVFCIVCQNQLDTEGKVVSGRDVGSPYEDMDRCLKMIRDINNFESLVRQDGHPPQGQKMSILEQRHGFETGVRWALYNVDKEDAIKESEIQTMAKTFFKSGIPGVEVEFSDRIKK